MPRRNKGPRACTSSEQNVESDQNESSNSSQDSSVALSLEDLPDPGLVKKTGTVNTLDGKEKKRVTFNFPLATKDGRYIGTGTIDLMETISDVPSSSNKPGAKEIVFDLTKDAGELAKKIQNLTKNQVQPITQVAEKAKKRELPKNNQPKPVEVKNHDSKEKKDCTKKGVGKKTMAKAESNKPCIGKKKVEAVAARIAADAQREAAIADQEKQAVEDYEEYHKIYKPGECLKYMKIEMHPDLYSQWYMEQCRRDAAAAGVPVVRAADMCDPGLILFTRNVPSRLASQAGQLKLSSSKKYCERAIYMINAELMVELVASDSVAAHVARKHDLVGGKLTFVVYGSSRIFNDLPLSGAPVTRNKFGKAMADLQMNMLVSRRVDAVLVESAADIARLVLQYTRAIAETPYKKAKRDTDERAQFYMKGDNKNCVTVDKDGNGLSRLWEQMIAVLPKSSLEIARSLGAKYTTPRALTQELLSSGGLAKIGDIGVQRTNVPGAKPRRLGPEFARKLYTLFTAEDGNMVIE